MKKFLTSILFALAFAAVPASAFTMDVQGGIVNHVSELKNFNLNVYGHLWYPIDQMLFFGIGSGYQELDNESQVPVSGSVWIRLPIGSRTLPVFTGDWGYLIGSRHQMCWRGGGGCDIKNGDFSWIMLMGG